jgi:hypothetical protein
MDLVACFCSLQQQLTTVTYIMTQIETLMNLATIAAYYWPCLGDPFGNAHEAVVQEEDCQFSSRQYQ